MQRKVCCRDERHRIRVLERERKIYGLRTDLFKLADYLHEQYCGTYDSADALPMWIQERLAVLMMTPTEFPTVEISTVGRRISEYVFWVFAPETPPEAVAYLPVPGAAAIYPAKAPSIDLLHLICNHMKESRK